VDLPVDSRISLYFGCCVRRVLRISIQSSRGFSMSPAIFRARARIFSGSRCFRSRGPKSLRLPRRVIRSSSYACTGLVYMVELNTKSTIVLGERGP